MDSSTGSSRFLVSAFLIKRFLQLKIRLGDRQVLVAPGDFSLGAHHIHRRNGLQLELLLGIFEALLGEREGLLVDLLGP